MLSFFETTKYKHVLLLGASGVGKTKFLYENYLQNKFKEPIVLTEGYNMESIKMEPNTYGIWDLSASPEFLQLWPVFYNFIPFELFMFVIRYRGSSNKEKKKIGNESWGQSRKLLWQILAERPFKDKPFLLIVNVDEDAYVNKSAKNQERIDFLEEVKECMMWNEIKLEHKDAVVLNVTEYMDHEQVYGKMHKMHIAKYGDGS